MATNRRAFLEAMLAEYHQDDELRALTAPQEPWTAEEVDAFFDEHGIEPS